MNCEWQDKIFGITDANFQALALEVFHFQYQHNPVYRSFTQAVQTNIELVNSLENIPFLPIAFFKSHEIKTGNFAASLIFESSGTTQAIKSRHLVKDSTIYSKSFISNFEENYGSVKDCCIIGLLPSYLERTNSSLIYMVNELINISGHSYSGFYLDDFKKLYRTLVELESIGQKTILIGVTFALLDFAEKFPMPLKNVLIMETGGMKGRREEMTRNEVHDVLKKAFFTKEIHSEYGMTELLSQAYSKNQGFFQSPPWMKILVRDDQDPFMINKTGGGALNIIDLANIYSCSFIATEDVGKIHDDGKFEILGRMDGSDLRGCSLLLV